MYQPTFDLNASPEMSYYRQQSIDYSRRPSFAFTSFNSSEASLSDHEQQTPSPFNSYEEYHPLDKRRMNHPSPYMEYPWYMRSPIMYPMEVYPPSVYMNQYPTEGILRDRTSSSFSSSSDSSFVDSPPSKCQERKKPAKSTHRSRGRRASHCSSDTNQKAFACTYDECGKVFRRSEHLKRHIRSIHTLEKPYQCPYQSCSKKFSRSDNLNQHIRIHRNTSSKDKRSAVASSRLY